MCPPIKYPMIISKTPPKKNWYPLNSTAFCFCVNFLIKAADIAPHNCDINTKPSPINEKFALAPLIFINKIPKNPIKHPNVFLSVSFS